MLFEGIYEINWLVGGLLKELGGRHGRLQGREDMEQMQAVEMDVYLTFYSETSPRRVSVPVSSSSEWALLWVTAGIS